MIKYTLLLFLAILTGINLYAQRVVISENVDQHSGTPDFGMNRKNFRHFYTGIQLHAGHSGDNGAAINYGRSMRYEIGSRYKRKFSEVFSGGYEVFARRDVYHMKQSDSKTVPDALMHDKEKLVFLTGGLGLYQRINFGNRGNHMGQFLDLGGYGEWFIQTRHATFDKVESMRVKVKRSGLPYTSSFGYGIMGRLGFGSFVLRAGYRLSDLFLAESDLPELPRYTFGVEFGMHPK